MEGIYYTNEYHTSYIVKKSYEGIQESRILLTIEDCLEQIKEWDEKYFYKLGIENFGLSFNKTIEKVYEKLLTQTYNEKKYFFVYDYESNNLLYEGNLEKIRKCPLSAKTLFTAEFLPNAKFEGKYKVVITDIVKDEMCQIEEEIA